VGDDFGGGLVLKLKFCRNSVDGFCELLDSELMLCSYDASHKLPSIVSFYTCSFPLISRNTHTHNHYYLKDVVLTPGRKVKTLQNKHRHELRVHAECRQYQANPLPTEYKRIEAERLLAHFTSLNCFTTSEQEAVIAMMDP